ncbi:hypothetical protein FRC08_005278 [Ceratobasidium sp. 394]|nr:hypothetical protein FRC08_005278 [Ceratobasidium sp. 394]
MPPKKRNNQTSQKSTEAPSHGPVELPFREARANRAAARAAKNGQEPAPPPAAPTIQRPHRNIPIVEPEIIIPGQEDIPPSPRGSGHVTITLNPEGAGVNGPIANTEPASHPFGQSAEPQIGTRSDFSNGDELILPGLLARTPLVLALA